MVMKINLNRSSDREYLFYIIVISHTAYPIFPSPFRPIHHLYISRHAFDKDIRLTETNINKLTGRLTTGLG